MLRNVRTEWSLPCSYLERIFVTDPVLTGERRLNHMHSCCIHFHPLAAIMQTHTIILLSIHISISYHVKDPNPIILSTTNHLQNH